MTDDDITRIRQGRDSPCVGVCNALFAPTCQGCGRTAYEDSHWVAFTEAEKTAVWDRIIRQGWRISAGIIEQKRK